MRCTNCQGDNPAGTRFCGHCGTPIRQAAPAPAPAAELRQLTVLFCDLVGSTSFSEALDPEDFREVIATYQSVCERVIRKHEGHIAQYLGDGVLVYFGYPVAHEDDDRRAVRTGLEIIADLEAASARLYKQHRIRLNARVGIHTGAVVVGEVGGGERREQLAMGKTPNLAARIQNIAAPGTVVVSEDTHAIVRGYFEFTPLGVHEIKGLAKPVQLYRPVRESGAESRLDAQRRMGLTPLAGRNRELAQLENIWSSVPLSGGQAVLISGEAGIGKSRLTDAFRQRARAAMVLECFCTPYAQSTPLFPIVGMIERALGFTREMSEGDKRAAIVQRMTLRGIYTEETGALIASLLAVPGIGPDPLAGYSPQKRRERTLETLLEWLKALASERPALWIIEDLHWVDPTTLELLTAAMGAFGVWPLLLLMTSRPGFVLPSPPEARLTVMPLARLAISDTTSMAMSVAHGKAMPPEVMTQIVARAEGIPLFVEEITKAVLEMGMLVEREDRFEAAGPLSLDMIPTTVQSSLNARLDRLGAAKGIAQVAATIGREFSYALLRDVAKDEESDLRGGLDRLMAAELLSRVPDVPDEVYLFKHALVRDAAYQSLLKKSRRGLHERIAAALTTRFPGTVAQNPELVAEHFTAADQPGDAVKWWLKAGQQAVSRAANHEALTRLRRGLEVVASLPEDEQNRNELDLLVAMMPALIAAETWASSELKRIYARAGELVELLGETPHRLTVLAGRMLFHWVAGRLNEALPLALELYELAQAIGDPGVLLVAHQGCCGVYNYHGDFRKSIEHLLASFELLEMQRERILAEMFGLSPCVGNTGYASVAYWMTGQADKGWEVAERGRQLALDLGHPPSLGFALCNRLQVLYTRGDVKAILEHEPEAARVVREERLGFYEPHATIYRGWALSELGNVEEGVAVVRGAVERYYAAGNGAQQISFLVIVGNVEWKAGNWERAFAAVDLGIRRAAELGEGMYEPEVHRLKGWFLAERAFGRGGQPAATGVDLQKALAEAEESIRRGMKMAQAQDAVMLEMRCLLTLCRMRRELGQVPPEREALARCLDAIHEGAGLPELIQARAELGRL